MEDRANRGSAAARRTTGAIGGAFLRRRVIVENLTVSGRFISTGFNTCVFIKRNSASSKKWGRPVPFLPLFFFKYKRRSRICQTERRCLADAAFVQRAAEISRLADSESLRKCFRPRRRKPGVNKVSALFLSPCGDAAAEIHGGKTRPLLSLYGFF